MAATLRSRKLAKLSSISYELANEARANRAKELGYTVDNELSTPDYAVFVPTASGEKPVIAYRGTIPTNADDLLADAHIVAGTLHKSHRYRKSKEAAHRALQKYGTLEVTGHSLGGAIAEHVNDEIGVDATTFNAGVSPFFKRKRGRSNLTRHVNRFDPISSGNAALAHPGLALASLAAGSHSLSQYF